MSAAAVGGAQRVEVGAAEVECAELRGEFVERAFQARDVGALPVVGGAADARAVEIHQHDLRGIFVHQHIVGVQVGVPHAFVVEAAQRLADGAPVGLAERRRAQQARQRQRRAATGDNQIRRVTGAAAPERRRHRPRRRQAAPVQRRQQTPFGERARVVPAAVQVAVFGQARGQAAAAIVLDQVFNAVGAKEFGALPAGDGFLRRPAAPPALAGIKPAGVEGAAAIV